MIKLKHLASCVLALAMGATAVAQTDLTTTPLPKESLQLPQTLDYELEQLLQRWYEGYERRSAGPLAATQAVAVPNVPDSVYINMMNRIPSAIRLSYNSIVRESIELYLYRRRPLLSTMLSLADLYFPDIESELDKHGLPLELKYLTIVESSLNPTAISPAGAAGLWQFMLPTARIYGLTVNSLIDERMDPIKGTEAACKMLSELYRIYKDWWLVMAAYNCGAGNVNRAIARAGGGRKTFWQIYPHLPRETRKYVPLYIGVYYAMYHHKHYGIQPRELGRTLATEYYQVTKPTTFSKIASLSGISVEQIRAYNPQYRRGIIPWSSEGQLLRLPLKAVLKLEGYTPEDLASHEVGVVEEGIRSGGLSLTSNAESSSSSDSQYSYHRVQRRETVESIARRYGVSPRDIREWNNLGRRGLRRGQRIIVGLKERPKARISELESSSAMGKAKVDSLPAERVQREVVQTERQYTYHKVKKGETIDGLARQYGVRAADIRAWNGLGKRGLRRGESLIVGQREVKVSKPSTGVRVERTSKNATPESSKVRAQAEDEAHEARPATAERTGGAKHTVRRGESLITIAMRYNTSVAKLRELNGLRKDAISAGDVLIVGEAAVERAGSSTDESREAKDKSRTKYKEESKKSARAKTHTVSKGDTPYNIAKRYDITLEELRKWNKLKGDKVQIGETLKVSK